MVFNQIAFQKILLLYSKYRLYLIYLVVNLPYENIQEVNTNKFLLLMMLIVILNYHPLIPYINQNQKFLTHFNEKVYFEA